MRRLSARVMIAMACLVAGAGLAEASHAEAVLRRAAASRTVIEDGAATLAPLAYIRFCRPELRGCQQDGREGRVELSHARLAELVEVNRDANARIRPRADVSPEISWSLTAQTGDCNTFALQKRDGLIGLGWPVGALSLAVVLLPDGRGHLVLVVRTSHGDLVLDNLRADIVPWSAAGYSWRKIQSASDPQDWVEVRAAANLASLLVLRRRTFLAER